MKRLLHVAAPLLFALCLSILGSCRHRKSTSALNAEGSEIPRVCAVNYPLAYFAERIGGEKVSVDFPCPRDQDPRDWKPAVSAISKFQESDLILLNGADYARWVPLVSLPSSRLANTTDAVTERYITTKGSLTHQHGPTGDHSDAELASITWLDFEIAIAQALAVKDALIDLVPEQANEFEERFTGLRNELLAFDQSLVNARDGDEMIPMFGSHSAYQYLARRYGLSIQYLQWEPDRMPSEDEWEELNDVLAKHPARAMLWASEPLPKIRNRLSQLGLKVMVFDPAANKPAQGDFLSVMRDNTRQLTELLRSP